MGTDNTSAGPTRYAVPAVEARAARAISEGRTMLTDGASPITVADHLRTAYADMVMIETALALAAAAELDKAWAARQPTGAAFRLVNDRGLGEVRRTRTVTSAGRRFTPLPSDHPMRLANRRSR